MPRTAKSGSATPPDWSALASWLIDEIEKDARTELQALERRKPTLLNVKRVQFFTVALSQTQHARDALRACPAAARAVYHAAQLASLHLMSDALLGISYRAHQRARSKNGVETKKTERIRETDRLFEAVQQYRKRHPGATPRAIATALLSASDLTTATTEQRHRLIDAKRQRIKRLENT